MLKFLAKCGTFNTHLIAEFVSLLNHPKSIFQLVHKYLETGTLSLMIQVEYPWQGRIPNRLSN